MLFLFWVYWHSSLPEEFESCSEDYYGDGSVILVSTAGDCNDTSATTHPGAAENDSTTTCLADNDEDGHGATGACYTLSLYDSFGDGWTYGGSPGVEIYVDGVMAESYTLSGGYWGVSYWCGSGTTIEIGYEAATSYNNEISFVLYDNDGTELYASGSGPTGTDISAGDTPLYTGTMVDSGGTDSDDTDATVQ